VSGIVGIFYLDDRSVESKQLESMVDRIAHRGPDGSNLWLEGSVGFGHRMLWTTPESLLETLPLANATGDIVLTADARIDNRDELIQKLDLSDRPAEKITDCQLILSAYEKWGKDCPQYLLGDFAFAIWDGRQQRLFCARDHIGVKPFYYCYQPGKRFFFASEIKALLSLPEIPRRINEVRIADYLYPMLEDKAITSYQGIFRLPPAQTLTVSVRDDIKLQTYWSLDPSRELILGSDEEYAEAFREIFTEAVRCRLRSAFPVGSHLSGGLDSSSVSCVARNLLQEKDVTLHTFSNIFDEVPECDERTYIEPILEQGGFIPHYQHPDRVGPLTEWEHFFECQDESFIGPSCYLPWILNRAAQQAGVRVVLDGCDGDTTVCHGDAYFAELARREEWEKFLVEAKAVSQNFKGTPLGFLYQYGIPYLEELAKQWQWVVFAKNAREIRKYFKISYKQLFLQHGLKPIVPEFCRSLWKKLRGQSEPVKKATSVINPRFAEKMGMSYRLESFGGIPKPPVTVRDFHWRKLTSGVFPFVLELSDLGAAAFSIEARHPFMDKRLIEFCLAVPAEQKLNQGWSRLILRRAMEGILPKPVQWRGGKTDMAPNFIHGLLKHNRDLIDEVVRQHSEDVTEYIDLNLVRQCRDLVFRSAIVQESNIVYLWQYVSLALWCRAQQVK